MRGCIGPDSQGRSACRQMWKWESMTFMRQAPARRSAYSPTSALPWLERSGQAIEVAISTGFERAPVSGRVSASEASGLSHTIAPGERARGASMAVDQRLRVAAFEAVRDITMHNAPRAKEAKRGHGEERLQRIAKARAAIPVGHQVDARASAWSRAAPAQRPRHARQPRAEVKTSACSVGPDDGMREAR
jgi:hypothetical protein